MHFLNSLSKWKLKNNNYTKKVEFDATRLRSLVRGCFFVRCSQYKFGPMDVRAMTVSIDNIEIADPCI